ncbi:DUF4307 domain-containing protein [Corynebacterium aquatimens]|uniref:DUF4307 domain-containing protein n=1 Tax=Corynebacterium aquatimens TaxID=1190508 RepID=A0A931DZS3_9CORY|nr:DUF4307 domain-containing protein [Corynebacterium aquatimens]MBG6121207.1 hypothetical protein [Corynebacterium aquatimens]
MSNQRPSSRSASPRTSSRPASRYGTAKPSALDEFTGKAMVITTALLLIALVVFGVRLFLQRDDNPVTASFISHERIDESTSRVWIDVERKNPNVPSYCIVTSLNYEKAEVGRRDVMLPAGGEKSQRMAVDIPTRDLPVSGKVYGCSTTIPFFLDPEQSYTQAR